MATKDERVHKLMITTGKEQNKFKFSGGGRYPGCFGKYPDCPEEAKAFVENKNKEGFKIDDAPRECRLCPLFKW